MAEETGDPKIPNRLLTAGVLVTTAVLAWTAYGEYVQYDVERVHRPRQVRVAKLSQVIAGVAELQSMIVAQAAETGDPQWEQRYGQLQAQEDAAIMEVTQVAPDGSEALAVPISAVNRDLAAIERRIFDLVRSGQRQEARALLRGGEYDSHRGLYARWLAAVAKDLDAKVQASMLGARENARRNLVINASVIAGLLVGWFFLLRTFSRWQSALRDANRRLARDLVEIKRVDRMKTEFVSTVSHELRTPLTSIRGSLGLLAGGIAGKLPDAAVNLVEIAKSNCERLIRLINDILDIEKLESGQMRFDSKLADLRAVIEQAVAANASFAAQHNVAVRLDLPDEPMLVHADVDRLNQVVTNLLSNAAKFSPAGAEVDVRASRIGDRATVQVRDRGPGIPEEFQERIFEKFSQADSSDTRAKGGSGLGLSISKAIVERLGGTIGFFTGAGEGTNFHFDLPLWTSLAAPETKPSPSRPCVLVVEDDRDIARLIGMMLDRAGYDADLAFDAAQARERLAAGTYCAMTVDLKLPDLGGLMLIRAVRRDERTATLPIIVVSAIAEEGRTSLNGEALSISDWMGKPIDENRLVVSLRNAVDGTPAGRARVLHVLHIEDDPDVQRVVATMSQDFAVFEFATTLREARMLLQRRRFDLVLLDIVLPDGSGWDLIPEINRAAPVPPVVVFSAHDATAAEKARVEAVLVKARTSNEELLETIRKLLDRVPAAAGS